MFFSANADHEQCEPHDATMHCRVARRFVEVVPAFKKCHGIDGWECQDTTECEWGAQANNQCGISEVELIRRLAGREGENNPYVQYVEQLHQCHSKSENLCSSE